MESFTDPFMEPVTESFTSHSLGEGKGREKEGKGELLIDSPSIHSVTYVTRGAAAPIVTPSPLAHPDAMDGLTISLSDMPDIGGDGPPLCETALHCDSAIPADYLVQFTDPVLVDEWGDFVWPICTQCHGRGSRIEGDVEAWRIVQVLR